jgi:hypothetical protein
MNRIHLFGAVILLIFTTHAHSALVMYSVGNGSGTVIGTTIDRQSSMDSVFMRDNGQRGSFQLNSINISALDIPIPSALWLFGSGLLGLIGIARRKNRHN